MSHSNPQQTSHQIQQLEQRVVELETKLAFMEDTVEAQNSEIQRFLQQQQRMQVQLGYLAGKLKTLEPSNIASQRDETPPPHY